MPTYTVHCPAGLLGPEQKHQLARAITRAHNEVTGAQSFFAQVLIVEKAAGDWFVGGEPIDGQQLFVHGQIRAGRSAEVKAALLRKLMDVTATICGCPTNRVWAYLAELAPEQMAEFGHVLPQPGEELAWLAALPAADRRLMESIGARR